MNRTYYTQDKEFGAIFWFEENGKLISFSETPGNRHYQEYLAWLAEGNEPEVIDEQS